MTSVESGAAPETPTRSRPPSRSRTFAKTSRSASRCCSARTAPTGAPSRRARLARAPTPSAQSPIRLRRPPARSISPGAVARLDGLRLQVPCEAPVRLELLEPVKRDDLAQVRQRAANGDELPGLLLVLGEGEHSLAVVEDVFALLCGARGIEADDDGADRHYRQVEQDPVEPGAGEDRHAIAVAHAAREQPLGEHRDALRGLVP